jgi:hypothetical protein
MARQRKVGKGALLIEGGYGVVLCSWEEVAENGVHKGVSGLII